MAVGFPNGIDLRNQRATNAASPSSGTDLANKDYVDNVARGLDWKESVRAATTAAGTLATSFANGSVIDGVTLATGNRILIKDQAAGAENGIYTVNASGAPTRAIDADSNAEVTSGLTVTVTEGTVNGNRVYMLTTDDPITVGTTALVWSQLGGGGDPTMGGDLSGTASNAQIVANAVGTTELAAGAVTAAKLGTGAVKGFASSIGDGSATSYVVTHNLGTTDVHVMVYDNTSKDVEIPDVDITSTNTVTVIFGAAPAASAKRVVVMGVV